ncbi:MAG: DUF3822 family protein [Lewinellaceae bacterium]|nr:DUF3822 family protein [Lewinellaceae bacterium]
MVEKGFDIEEEVYSRQHAAHQKLSILIGMDSFSYVIVDNQQQLLVFRSFSQPQEGRLHRFHMTNWQTVFTESDHLRQTFREVRVAIDLPQIALVPGSLYKPEAKQAYLQGIASLPTASNIKSDSVASMDSFAVYAVPGALEAMLDHYLPGRQQWHLYTALIPHLQQRTAKTGTAVFAKISSHKINLFVFQHGQLTFANAFPCVTGTDHLYYILAVMEQFSLNPKEVPVQIFGHLLPDSAIFRQLSRYLPKIQFLENNTPYQPGPKLKLHPGRFYLDHLTLLQV